MSLTQLYLTKDLVVNGNPLKAGDACCKVPGDPAQWARKVVNNGKHEKGELAETWNEVRTAKAIRRGVLVSTKPEVKEAKKPLKPEETPQAKAKAADAKIERNPPREANPKPAKKKKD